jgi:hypothetical protein
MENNFDDVIISSNKFIDDTRVLLQDISNKFPFIEKNVNLKRKMENVNTLKLIYRQTFVQQVLHIKK